MRLARPFALAALTVGLMAGTAPAGTVSLTYDHSTPTAPSGTFQYAAGTAAVGGTPGPYYFRQNTPINTGLPNTITAFCVEVNQPIASGATTYMTYSPLSATPGLTTNQVGLITKLFANDYSRAWDNTSFAGSSDATAFQLALWEIMYDGQTGSALNVSSGNFQVKSGIAASTIATANSWLTALAGQGSNLGDYQLVYLKNGYKQDQITMIPNPPKPGNPVPAPAGAVLLGMGGLLAAARNLRKRVAAPTTAA